MTTAIRTACLLAISLSVSGCGKTADHEGQGGTMQLSSSAFREGEKIPVRYTGDGDDRSPPLAWPDPPEGTASFAVICDDPDAPGRIWVHWVFFNISPDRRGLDEGIPSEGTLGDRSRHGKNDFGNLGYGGPAPPRGKPHRYYFKLYALDTMLSLQPGAIKDDLLKAMKGHILAEGQLMGKYQR